MKAWAGLLAAALLIYPLLYYALLDVVGLAGVGLAFAGLAGGRVLCLTAWPWRRRLLTLAALVVFVAAAVQLQREVWLKLYPVAVNLGLLVYGASTLWHPPSAIERLVRALGQPVSEAGIVYMRNVTIMWCAFFAINGSVALFTAVAQPTAVWALYNGAASYAVVAVLFGVEYLVRRAYKRRVYRRQPSAFET